MGCRDKDSETVLQFVWRVKSMLSLQANWKMVSFIPSCRRYYGQVKHEPAGGYSYRNSQSAIGWAGVWHQRFLKAYHNKKHADWFKIILLYCVNYNEWNHDAIKVFTYICAESSHFIDGKSRFKSAKGCTCWKETYQQVACWTAR